MLQTHTDFDQAENERLQRATEEIKRYERVFKELREAHNNMCKDMRSDQVEWLSGWGAAIDYIEDNLWKEDDNEGGIT